MTDPTTPSSADDEELVPLEDPPALPPRRGSELGTGLPILPEERFKAYTPDQLEIIAERWLRVAVERRYERVLRWGGTGDKGRDVVAYPTRADRTLWDNYQCKRYAKALAPGDIWPELCKLVYWVSRGAYPKPRRYTLVAPLGVGPQAADLVDSAPDELRAGLLRQWATHGAKLCPLSEIEDEIKRFDFPELDAVRPGEIIDDFKGAPDYAVLFGGGLSKPRPPDTPPPDDIAANELTYIDALVEAYDEHCTEPVRDRRGRAGPRGLR